MSVSFPIETTSVINETKPAVVAQAALPLPNVRLADATKVTFTPHWSGGALSSIEGEWVWENGAWDQTGTVWTPGSVKKNHYVANLLDAAFLAANPEVAIMVQVFSTMTTVSKRAGVI